MTLAYERIDTPTNSNPAKTGSLLCPAQSPHRQHRRLGLPRLGLCQQRLTLINNHSRSRSRSRSRPGSHLSSYTTAPTHSLRPASRTRKSIPSTEHSSSSSSSSNKSSRKHTMADSKRNSAFSEADLQEYMMLQNPDLSMWMTAIAIDDDDLTFSGKSLSTWYEEDRRRLSIGDLDEVASREEEHRGRSRERPTNRKDTNKQHHKSKSKDSSGHSSS